MTVWTLQRRQFVAGAAALATAALGGCERTAPPLLGGFTGIDMARGHQLRDLLKTGSLPAPAVVRRTQVVIAGGGVAGLAAARALRLAGVHDFALLELEDTPGGNSRGGAVNGITCPQGAHYLPVPGDDAREVQDLLEELGVRQRVAGRWQYDERHLCHSPQERLFFDGEWQEGLLPVHGVGDATLAQYRRFARAVDAEARTARFAMPALKLWSQKQPLAPAHQALDAITFEKWLAANGLDDAHLRWYLDYCCRDDYGAGAARVSAWAGIHYFASRHGFHAPGEAADEARESVLTWPEGNGWLTQRLAEPLQSSAQGGGQLRTATSVLRITEGRHGVEVDALNHRTGNVERWVAPQCIVALPVLLAARVVQQPPAFLTGAAQRLQWAPWLVANIHINSPLADRPGAAPAWDNVLYADPTAGGLGYVNAGHQRLDPRAALTGPTVLTYYQALGDVADGRQQLATQPWQHWADAALDALSVPHPDLRERATRVDITRYGHAMAIPTPGVLEYLSKIGLHRATSKRKKLSKAEQTPWIPTPTTARLAFAHSDWSGYSVFEEAFTRGHGAGLSGRRLTPMAGTELHIDVAQQRLALVVDGATERSYRISTALNGVGERNGSGCTPRGQHRVRAKVGAGCVPGTVFVGRRATGEVYSPELAAAHPGRDWILSRILWLTGCEPGVNRGGAVDTLRRYIYIHGCPDDCAMGVPLSHGCVRLANADVIDLFDRVVVGTRVTIHSTPTPWTTECTEGTVP